MRPIAFVMLAAVLGCAAAGVLVLSRGTGTPRPSDQSDTLRGVFESSFERSVLRGCEGGSAANVSWLTSNDPLFYKRVSAAGGPPAYIRFRGRLEHAQGNQRFGHLGAFTSQVTVTELIDVRPGSGCP